MNDLNDFSFFAAVVQHGGFTAAARATGVDKARLSRHVGALEAGLGVRLLTRSTRSVSLTEAGQRFYIGCLAVLGSAREARDSVAELQKEPSGTVRIGCPVVLAQNYLAPILPRYLMAHPKVTVVVEAGDRSFNPLEDGLDIALVADVETLPSSSLVARELARIRRVLVVGRDFDDGNDLPDHPDGLSASPLIARTSDLHDGEARWSLTRQDNETARIHAIPRFASNDIRMQLEAVSAGVGVALLPEPVVAAGVADGTLRHLLPEWSTPEYCIHIVYPLPRGVLPSVRSLIDFLAANLWTLNPTLLD